MNNELYIIYDLRWKLFIYLKGGEFLIVNEVIKCIYYFNKKFSKNFKNNLYYVKGRIVYCLY